MKSPATGYLYFIKSVGQEACKVGFSTAPETRLPNLQSGNPEQLFIEGMIPITVAAEEAFHNYMKPHRIAREWYPDGELMFCLEEHLADFWAEKAEAETGERVRWPHWDEMAANVHGVYVSEREMIRELRRFVREYFAAPPHEPYSATEPNHWA